MGVDQRSQPALWVTLALKRPVPYPPRAGSRRAVSWEPVTSQGSSGVRRCLSLRSGDVVTPDMPLVDFFQGLIFERISLKNNILCVS